MQKLNMGWHDYRGHKSKDTPKDDGSKKDEKN